MITVEPYVKTAMERLLTAAVAVQNAYPVKQGYLPRSPVLDLYAAWEAGVVNTLNVHWREKADRLKNHFDQVINGQKAKPKPEDILMDDKYWRLWAADYLYAMQGHIELGVETGVEAAAKQLMVQFTIGTDANALNPRVTKYARTHSMKLANGLTKTDIRNLRQQLAAWTEAHEDFPALVGRVDKIINNPVRAELIASTEATRVYARGNILTWQESGVIKGKQWKTAQDEIVCPVCKGLHNQIATLEGPRWRHAGGNAKLNYGSYVREPPAHPRCRCALAPWVKELPKYVAPKKHWT